MLELYEAYASYDEVMDLTESMIRDVAQEAMGTTALEWDGNAIDLGPRFRRWKLEEAVRELNPEISAADCRDREALAAHCRRSEEHTSELQSLMRISYAVFCLKKKKNTKSEKVAQK